SIVTVMQPAEPLMRQDATRGDGTHPVAWCSLPESEMRAVFVVITNVLREQSLQMPFIHRNDVIQQVSSAAFDPTLRDSILPGTFEGGPHRTHLQGTNGHGYFQSIFRIPVEDQELGSRAKRKRFPQLLDDPLAGGMTCNVEMENPSTGVIDDEEAVEDTEGDCWNCEEIHRGNGFPMIAQ